MTAQNIANNTHFIIESSALAMAAQQVSLVVDYVRGGGTLLLFSNPDQGGRTSANQILGALGVGLSGSAMSVTGNESGLSGSTLPWGTLSSTDSSVAGPVANLNGASLNWARTYILSGGQLLSQDGSPSISDAIRMDRFNLGRVYVFGTRLDSNLATGFQTLGTNAVFFQNILGTGSLSSGLPTGFVGGGVGSAPEPASFALTAFALAGVAVYARRKRS
ncbi:MAG: hypothetical protein JNK48_03340 [Bryobacterales bacterium]|nr:hypothetical protein [Bryobacterales bacterium]